MTDYLIELLNIATSFFMGFTVMLYPMWGARDVKARFVCVYLICFAALMCAALWVFRQYTAVDMNTVQIFKFAVIPFEIALPFIVFRKKMRQVIFLVAMMLMYGTAYIGIGNFIADRWNAGSPLLYSSLYTLAVTAITSPPLLIMLRRLHSNPDIANTKAFWRLAPLVPAAFFVLIMVQGNYITGTDFGYWFIIIRLLAYFMTLLICLMFDVVIRQIAEGEKARQKVEFYRKMSHSLRTPLTVISTNLQTAKRRPWEADELLDKSQEEIMIMADSISDALKDYDKGAGE